MKYPRAYPWQTAPFFRPTIALALGILAAYFYKYQIAAFSSIPFIASITLIGISVFILKNTRKKIITPFSRRFTGISLLFGFFTLGFGVYTLNGEERQKSTSKYTSEGYYLIEYLGDEQSDASTQKEIHGLGNIVQVWDHEMTPKNEHAQIWISKTKAATSNQIHKHDCFLIKGKIQIPNSQASIPDSYGFNEYLTRNNIQGVLIPKSEINTPCGSIKPPFRVALIEKISNYIETKASELFSNPELKSFFLTMLFGFRDTYTNSISTKFKATGTLHLLAVSGLHVSLLFFCISLLFGRIGFLRKLKWIQFLLSIAFIWTFVLIAGMGNSVTRAGIMASFLAIGLVLERKSNTLNLLMLSGFCMLIYKPESLFDVGFQLSFSALGGILAFSKYFENCFSGSNQVWKHGTQLFAATLAAQLGTLPIILYHFHSFPIYFLPANLVLIPLCTLATYMGFIWIVVGLIPLIGSLFTALLEFILNICLHVNSFFAHLPNTLSEGWWLEFEHSFLILIGTVFIAFGLSFQKKRIQWAGFAVVLGAFCSIEFSKIQNQSIIQEFEFKQNGVHYSETIYMGKSTLFIKNPHTEIPQKSDIEKLKSHWAHYGVHKVSWEILKTEEHD